MQCYMHACMIRAANATVSGIDKLHSLLINTSHQLLPLSFFFSAGVARPPSQLVEGLLEGTVGLGVLFVPDRDAVRIIRP